MTTTNKWRLVPAEPDQAWTDAFAARGPRIGSFVSTIRAVLETAPAPAFDLLGTLQDVRASLAFLPAADAAITGLDRIMQAVAPLDAAEADTANFSAPAKLRAPVADERTQQCAVHLTLTRTLGALGVAFDPPGPHRAYTYKDQPLNIGTYRLGDACQEASAASAGDLIDRGLSLLKSLQARGFGVFEVDAAHRNSANALASAPVAGEEQPAVRKGETNG